MKASRTYTRLEDDDWGERWRCESCGLVWQSMSVAETHTCSEICLRARALKAQEDEKP